MSDSSYNLKLLRGAEHEKEKAILEIERAKKLERLMLNPDFKDLILKDFIIDETVRQAEMAGSPALTKEMREASLIMVQGAGHLRRWMKLTLDNALRLTEGLPELEETILEMQQNLDAQGVAR